MFLLEARRFSWVAFKATHMPRIEAHKNRNLGSEHGSEPSHSCYRGVANLIRLMGRSNELWKVAGLVALTLFRQPYPRKAVTTFQAPVIDRLHWQLGFPFGDHDSQIATWDRSVGGTTGLLNHVGDVYLGIHDFTEFPPVVSL